LSDRTLDKPIIFLSRRLWRDLQNPPPRHWAHSDAPRREDTGLVLAFALSALALVSGVILSAIVIYRAANRIARARENDTFDLLAVTPEGGFGASWYIFASAVHYGLTLRTLNRMRWNALRLVLVAGLVTLLPLGLTALDQGDELLLNEAWSWLMFYAFLLPMMFFDYRYAVISGGLLSVLMPSLLKAESRAAALLAGTALHLGGYMAAALTGALMLPVVYEALGIAGWLADLSRPLMALGVFVLVHEAAALLLYRAAQTRLNGLDDAILRPAQTHS
jgi:hypothetical protein